MAGVAAALILVVACAKGDVDGLIPLGAADAGADAFVPSSETDPGGNTGDDDTTSSSGGTIILRDGGSSSGGKVTAACTQSLTKASWDFESGDQGWTHNTSDGATSNQTWPFDPWTRGVDDDGLPCPDGTCWGGELTENYAQCSRGELVSPTVDLTACTGQSVSLQFAQAFDFWTGSYSGATYFDGGIVELSSDNGVTWSVPAGTYPGNLKILKAQTSDYACVTMPYHADGKPGFTGTQEAAATFSVVVPVAMITNNVKIRFSTAAGVSSQEADFARAGTGAGWRIDDVKIVAGP